MSMRVSPSSPPSLVLNLPVQMTGTIPVKPFSQEDGFYGSLVADGQEPRVAALACDPLGHLIMVSLVGYDVSISAVFSTLWLNKDVPFLKRPQVQWYGTRSIMRFVEPYRQIQAKITGTHEIHALAISTKAHIEEGIRHPVDLVPEPTEDERANQILMNAYIQQKASNYEKRSRYVLGNQGEEMPHFSSFLANLYAMRVLVQHYTPDHPEYPEIWAARLWHFGIRSHLIEVIPDTLGVQAWKLYGHLERWNDLILTGLSEGWLPYESDYPYVPRTAQ